MIINSKTKNWLGMLVLCLGIAGFFVLMQVLGIFGSKIEYTNPVYVAKSFTPFAFMFGCAYFGTRILFGAGAALKLLLNLGIPLLIAFAIGYWLHATPENMRTLSYSCEDGAHFTINFVAQDEFQISAQEKLYTFKLESTSDERIRIFGNEEYAVTFTSTYGDDQIIFTHRNKNGPYSTICHFEP